MSIFVWRQWAVTNMECVLVGFYDSLWIPGEVKQADCNKYFLDSDYVPPFGIYPTSYVLPSAHDSADSPHERCTCGIYGYKRDFIPPYCMSPTTYLLGIAEIWGKIITAEQGYRAQFAKICALIDSPAYIAHDYCVPNLPSVEYARKEYFS